MKTCVFIGVLHGDELISMFNWSEAIKPVTRGVDLTVSEQVIELWANFITYGYDIVTHFSVILFLL